jgi:IclR family KDG regulon transcriptional repressor
MNTKKSVGETQLLSSVGNAARLLREFGKGQQHLGVSDLARRLGIAKSTAHRLVHTLTASGLLERDEETGTYRLSFILQSLGASAQGSSELHRAAAAVLDRLRNATKETVQIAVLDGCDSLYVERRESLQTLRTFGRLGNRYPAHATSTGKLLLAHLPPAELDKRLAVMRLTRKTPYTITDMAKLRAELGHIRARGWSENVSEAEIGIASISAPIRDSTGEVIAALSVAGPVQRQESGNLRGYVPAVMEGAAHVSRQLGWGGHGAEGPA